MSAGKKIIAFCCENSGYKASAPIRSSSPMREVEIIKVPCAGRVEIGQILAQVEKGADHVLIIGCPVDNCKYLRGNRRALKRVEIAKQALRDAGMKEDIICIELLSSVDSHKLSGIIKELNEK